MTSDSGEDGTDIKEGRAEGITDDIVSFIEEFVHVIELSAAGVFAVMFAIGVVDLVIQIGQATINGRITSPDVVIGIIDTGLLLLIIVEVYKTVIAYTRESETRHIVRLIIYTGLIAMVRKVIIFRIHEYGTTREALFVAVSYTIILFGLAIVLLIEQRTTR